MKISDFEFEEKRCSSIISGERDLVDSFTSNNGVYKIKGFKYSYSPKDDYFFINPQPKLESLNDYYNGHGKPLTQEQVDNRLDEYNKKGRPFEMAEYVSRYLRKLGKFSGNYLDFGCGGGELLYHNKSHYKVYGLEISDLARRHCEKLGIKMGKTLEEFKNVKFDLISAIDVIEHVPDPKALLISFKEVLKPDGAIFLRLPVIDGLTFNRKYPDKWKWVYSPYHLSMFSIKAVQRLSKVCGLSCEIIYDEIMHVNYALFCFRYQESFLMKNPLTRKICHLLFPIIRKLIIKKYSSDTVFVVLQKER